MKVLIAHFKDGTSQPVFGCVNHQVFDLYLDSPNRISQLEVQLGKPLARFEALEVPALQVPTILSPRELEIAEEISKGTRPYQISRLFKLSVRTVHAYRERIKEKLNVDSNAEIALNLRDRGLI